MSYTFNTALAGTLRKIRAVILDFDGTLYDYKNIAYRIISANPLDIYLVWSERRTRKVFAGKDFGTPENYYREYFIHLGKLCHKSAETMRNWYNKRYLPRMTRVLGKHFELRPGTAELFDSLAKALSTENSDLRGAAVYSDYPCLKERMAIMGLESEESIPLFGPESFGAQKPSPGPFKGIARKLGVPPEEILVIGDREDTDGRGALAAGMYFFRLIDGRRRYFRLDPDRIPPPGTKLRGAAREILQPEDPRYLGSGTWETVLNLMNFLLNLLQQGRDSA